MIDAATDTEAGTDPALRRHWRLRFPVFSAEQLFALVSDIESYPQFVPGCVATRILERTPDGRRQVDNVFGAGPLRWHFRSIAEADPPHRLEIVSQDGPWRRFAMLWRFTPEDSGCRVDVDLDVGFRSPLLAALAPTALPRAEPRIIGAFEARAQRLYASGTAAETEGHPA